MWMIKQWINIIASVPDSAERQALNYFQGVQFPPIVIIKEEQKAAPVVLLGFPYFSETPPPSLPLCQHLVKQLH